MERMKAVIYSRKGFAKKLNYCETNKPVPSENEVLVRVHAVSLNAADYRSMSLGIIPPKKIFGADVAGIVESAGNSAGMFKPGDEVFGDLASYGFGGLAEYVAVNEKALAAKPQKISFADAAALPMAGLTALQALRNLGRIREGDKVLITGSAGGVGTFAIQLARYFGAEVTGVCSTRNISQTLSIGADHAIDYTREDFLGGDKRYDIILAVNGNYPLLSYKRSLSDNGTYIMVGGSLSQIFKSLLLGRILSTGSKKMKSLSAKASRDDLQFIAMLAETGKIRPMIDRTYPLDKADEAMSYLRQGHSTGKVVISVR